MRKSSVENFMEEKLKETDEKWSSETGHLTFLCFSLWRPISSFVPAYPNMSLNRIPIDSHVDALAFIRLLHKHNLFAYFYYFVFYFVYIPMA